MTEQTWIKSSYSGSQANCVEVARNPADVVAVRDSKDPHGPVLAIERCAWQAFTDQVKDGTPGLT
jgi:Domain of unknown function (DUF397)